MSKSAAAMDASSDAPRSATQRRTFSTVVRGISPRFMICALMCFSSLLAASLVSAQVPMSLRAPAALGLAHATGPRLTESTLQAPTEPRTELTTLQRGRWLVPIGAGLALGGAVNAAMIGRTCGHYDHDATGPMIGGIAVAGLGIALTFGGGVKIAGAGPALRGDHRVSAGAKAGMLLLALGGAATSYSLLTALQVGVFDACTAS